MGTALMRFVAIAREAGGRRDSGGGLAKKQRDAERISNKWIAP